MNTRLVLYGTMCLAALASVANAQTGACCEANGICSQTSANICSIAGGAWSGDGTTCGEVDCFGACCYTDGTCIIDTEINCIDSEGAYAGGGVTCESGPCASRIGSSFIYQGQLKQDGQPYTGNVDMVFTLWDARVGNVQIGPTLTFDGVEPNGPPIQVTNGLFQIDLDFGVDSFDGWTRWLEVSIQSPSGSGNGYETLSPRQRIAPAPYSSQTRGLFVTDDNDVCIGTTEPQGEFHVATQGTNSQDGFVYTHNGNQVFVVSPFGIEVRDESTVMTVGASVQHETASIGISTGSSSAVKMTIARFKVVFPLTGNVGIHTDDPAFALHVNGDAAKPGGGSWTSVSDVRLKKNIEPLEGSLEKLLQLRGVNFEYIDPESIEELEGIRTGLIAQEVEEVFPDWVGEHDDGTKHITVRGFEALAIEALRQIRQEYTSSLAAQQEHIESLQAQLEEIAIALEEIRANK